MMLSEDRKDEIRREYEQMAETYIEAAEVMDRVYEQLPESVKLFADWCDNHCRMCGAEITEETMAGGHYASSFTIAFCSEECEEKWWLGEEGEGNPEKDFLQLNPWIYCSPADLIEVNDAK